MSNMKLFESKQIRTAWNESDQKWYFAVAVVVRVLTDAAKILLSCSLPTNIHK